MGIGDNARGLARTRRSSGRVRIGADPRLLALAVIAGAGGIYCLPAPPALAFILAPLPICLLCFPGRAIVAFFLLAAAWTSYHAQQQLAGRWPAARDGDVVWVQGRVAGLASREAMRTRFILARRARPGRIRLSWYDDAPALLPGDCLRVKAKLDTPHGSANPGTFDYEAWLWRKGIDATGYIKQAGTCDKPPVGSIDRWRASALKQLQPMIADSPMRGVIEALTLGARDHITDQQWEVLRATGTSHLVAISGLHIGLIAMLLYLLARWLALRGGALLPARVLPAGVAFAGALGYAMLAGFALPTQRALVMVSVGLVAIVTTRDIAPTRALAFAAIGVIVWHPAAVLAPGFWLSFSAVAWLLYLARLRGRSRLAYVGRLQVGLVAGLMPITLWFFDQASLIAPLVNAVLIPAMVGVVPALLGVTLLALLWPALGGPLLQVFAQALGAGWRVLAMLAAWPPASVHAALPGILALLLALVGLAVLFMPRGLPGRWLAALLLAPALFGWRPQAAAIPNGAYRLTVLDVGQGQSVVVRTRNHTLVFDAGPAYRTGFDTGAAIVVPYLRHLGRARVDRLVISHADMDHRGGAAAIQRELDVGRRVGAKSPTPCRAGQNWHWDGVTFVFLYPSRGQRMKADTRNARSCVLSVTGPGGRALLTGDIEKPAERRLLDQAGQRLDSDILVVAHHGSASSTSRAFVAASSPEYALISAGWHNRWGFPADAVVARLRRAGAEIAATATAGALLVRVPPRPDRIDLRRWRVIHRRLWQTP